MATFTICVVIAIDRGSLLICPFIFFEGCRTADHALLIRHDHLLVALKLLLGNMVKIGA